jgi:2'-5' RNA ligase
MTDEANVLRLFVAIELPAKVRQRLADLQADLQKGNLGRLRWVRPENIHITLKFLGGTPADRQHEIEHAIGEAVDGVPPHELTLGKLGKFGGRQHPRVLWVDVGGEVEALKSLHKRIDERLALLGFPPEEKEFAAHLTLARVPQDMQKAVARPIDEVIASEKLPDLPIPVRNVSLMLSELKREGPNYTRLASFALT